jgi:SAM-dependent methyltransferase
MVEVSNLYSSDLYLQRNPSLGEEDSEWKLTKITPFVNDFVQINGKKKASVLDVGGGAGVILRDVCNFMMTEYRIETVKMALDLSPGALELQKRNNPDLFKALNEDIRKTSLCSKEIDLALMIDVLEHVPEPKKALKELRRVANFVIFKVPLQGNLSTKLLDLLSKGKIMKEMISDGHINSYRFGGLREDIETECGTLLGFGFTNVYEYSSRLKLERGTIQRLKRPFSNMLFPVAPRLCSEFITDYVVLLVRCYQ